MAQWNWQLQQAITTMFVCRDTISCGNELNSEQRQALITDVSAAVHFLQQCVAPRASIATAQTEEQVALPSASAMAQSSEQARDTLVLQSLYRAYHTYVDVQQDVDLGGFLARFKEVMIFFSQVQVVLSHDVYLSIADSLEHAREFIADVYYVFLDFMHTVSVILEENDIHLATEEVVVVGTKSADPCQSETPAPHDIANLACIYQAHQHLDQQHTTIKQRVTATQTLLAFLEETLDGSSSKRDAIVEQLKSANILLEDVAGLLNDYKRAVGEVLNRAR
jgi:hypothetical protein